MMTKFSEIQPGIRNFAMEVLLHHWPEWDINTLWPSQSQGKFDHSIEPWPGRDVVVVELLRALREAGMVNGVFRSDFAADPVDRAAALLLEETHGYNEAKARGQDPSAEAMNEAALEYQHQVHAWNEHEANAD
jgi:hypothetical protein